MSKYLAMKNKSALLSFLLWITVSLTLFAQNGQYLPGGLNLHNSGNNPFTDRKWKLVFTEEFNGPLDPDKWDIGDPQDGPVVPPNIAVAVPGNVQVQNGNCTLRIKKESAIDYNGNQRDFTYGSIQTNKTHNDARLRHEWERGMFEVKIKLAKAAWSHSTFWVYSGDLKGSEIDIVESQIKADRLNRRMIPSHLHTYQTCTPSGPTSTCDFYKLKSFTTHNDFHVYTCIWDKYYIYIYVDHELIQKVNKFEFAYDNLDAQRQPYENDAHNWITTAGYYWLKNCFFQINQRGNVILSASIDSKAGTYHWADPRQSIKQDQGLPDQVVIDWVRVYQRQECEEDEIITNPILLPYRNLSERNIVFGSQPQSEIWTNIATIWGELGSYKGESITMLPNFQSYPEYIPPTCLSQPLKWSAAEYQARQCPVTTNEYIDPSGEIPSGQEGEEEETEEPDLDAFACTDIDTVWVDSTINVLLTLGDTLSIDTIISYIEDTLGCEYWGYGGGGQGKPGRRSDGSPAVQYRTVKNQMFIDRIRIYPNPTTGAFHIEMPQKGNYTIRVMNMLGSTVHEGKMANEQKKSIQLDNNLPPGNYTIHISGDGLRHVERVTLIK